MPHVPAAASRAVAAVVKTAGLEAQINTAEQRAVKAEREVARLQERSRLLEQRAEEAEASAKESTTRASSAEARIAHAEGRAEVLAEHSKAATAAIERAARAEEKIAALDDLQTKMPALINGVVGALSYQPPSWYCGGMQKNLSQLPIKLEFEESAAGCEVELLRRAGGAAAAELEAAAGMAEAVTSAALTSPLTSPSFVQRAVGAVMPGMRRRDLKP